MRLRTRIGALLAGVVALAFGQPRAAAAQALAYTHTDFVHGFASSREIWTEPRAELGASTRDYVGARVPLGRVLLPAYPVTARYDSALANVSRYVYYPAGRHVLVGHSLGALTARGAYLGLTGVAPDQAAAVRAGIAGIIAVAAPHRGAPIADNADAAKGMLLDTQRRVNDALAAAKVPIALWTFLVGSAAGGTGAGLFGGTAAFVLIDKEVGNQRISVDDVARLTTVPSLLDLGPQDAAITRLNASTADAAIPRANIVGRIPTKHALLRLQETMNGTPYADQVEKLRKARLLFHGCKYVGYYTLVMSRTARRCGFALRVLDRVDDSWVRYTIGNGGRSFDGVVPTERSEYPGLTDPLFKLPVVEGANHFSIYQTRSGADRIVDAMRLLRMNGAQATPAPRPGNTLTAEIRGAPGGQVNVMTNWEAGVAGGIYPFQYVWTAQHTSEAQPTVVGRDVRMVWTPTRTGIYTLNLTVSDEFGARGVSTARYEAWPPPACPPNAPPGSCIPYDSIAAATHATRE